MAVEPGVTNNGSGRIVFLIPFQSGSRLLTFVSQPMSAFHFRLATLLLATRRQCHVGFAAHGAGREHAATRTTECGTAAARRGGPRAATSPSSDVDKSRFNVFARPSERKRRKNAAEAADAGRREKEPAAARRSLRPSRDVKVLEKLREHRLAQHRLEERRGSAKQLDRGADRGAIGPRERSAQRQLHQFVLRDCKLVGAKNHLGSGAVGLARRTRLQPAAAYPGPEWRSRCRGDHHGSDNYAGGVSARPPCREGP